MSTPPTDARCPRCGENLQPDAVFCGNCGEPVARRSDAGDAQDTVRFRPIGTDAPDDPLLTGPAGAIRSPWAPPGSADHSPPRQDVGAQLAAWGGPQETMATDDAQTIRNRGPRGFFLGLLAVLLILAVLALYTYDAWLGDDARETVEDLLPFLR